MSRGCRGRHAHAVHGALLQDVAGQVGVEVHRALDLAGALERGDVLRAHVPEEEALAVAAPGGRRLPSATKVSAFGEPLLGAGTRGGTPAGSRRAPASRGRRVVRPFRTIWPMKLT